MDKKQFELFLNRVQGKDYNERKSKDKQLVTDLLYDDIPELTMKLDRIKEVDLEDCYAPRECVIETPWGEYYLIQYTQGFDEVILDSWKIVKPIEKTVIVYE